MMTLRAALLAVFSIVSLLILGACGGESSDKSATVSITSIQPELAYTGVNTTISFEITPGAKTSEDELKWELDFGDGQTVSGSDLSGDATHIYQEAGDYQLTLSALAGADTLAEDTATLKVLGPVDLALSQTRATPANIRVGETLSISFTAQNIEDTAVEAPFRVHAYLSESAEVSPADIDDLLELGSTTVRANNDDEPVIEAGGSISPGFSAPIPEQTSPGDYYIVTWADPSGQFSDTNPDNNLDVSENIVRVQTPTQHIPDLEVLDVMLLPDRAFPTLNKVTRAFTISNQGGGDAVDVVAEVWLSVGDDELDPDEDILLEETAPFRVNAGEEALFDPKSFVLDEEIIPPAGEELEVYLIVEVAIQGDSPETNLDNNIAASKEPTIVSDERVDGTDIAVSDFEVSPEATYLNGTLHVTMNVKNEGTLDASSFFCSLYLGETPAVNTERDPRLTNINISSLPGGEERFIERDIKIPALFDPGTYYIYVVCDPQGTLDEPYRSNNQAIYESPIRITDQADIDLYVDSLTVPESAEVGDDITLVARLCVSGSNATGPTLGKLWRSAQSTPDFDAPALLEFDIPNINPGECLDLEIETVAECSDFKGQYQYGVKVDTEEQLPESDRDNNSALGNRSLAVSGEECSCEPDGRGNDEALNAYPIQPGSSSEQLCEPERCDYYSVELDADDSLIVNTTFEAERGELVTTLYDPSGLNQLDKDSNAGQQEVATFLASSAGAYIFSVCGMTSATQNLYELDVDVSAPPEGADVAARNLKVPARDSFSIGATFEVSFRVYNLGQADTPESFDARLVLSPTPTIGDGDDLLLEPATLSIPKISAGSSEEITATVTIPTSIDDGEYYLGVDLLLDDENPDNNQASSDKIRVETQCYDPLEPNDSFAEAAEISAGSYSNLVACTAADDYYKLCVENGKSFSARVEFDSSEGDIDMALYDEQYRRLATSAQVGSDFEEVGVDYVNGAQCYYLNVHLVTLEQVLQIDYDMTVALQDVDPELQCTGAFEPNDTIASASSLRAALGSSVELDRCPRGDTDFYYISLTAGQQVSFRGILDPADQQGTLRLQLYKPNHTVGPNQETAPGNPVAEIEDYRAPSTGTYYLQVTISGSQRRVTYDLEADGIGASGGVDLAVKDLTIGPGDYLPGDDVRFGFTLENLGADAATQPSYRVLLGDSETPDPDADLELDSFSLSSGLGGGDQIEVNGRADLPADAPWDEPAWLHIVAESHAETDINPANNTASTPIILSSQ